MASWARAPKKPPTLEVAEELPVEPTTPLLELDATYLDPFLALDTIVSISENKLSPGHAVSPTSLCPKICFLSIGILYFWHRSETR